MPRFFCFVFFRNYADLVGGCSAPVLYTAYFVSICATPIFCNLLFEAVFQPFQATLSTVASVGGRKWNIILQL